MTSRPRATRVFHRCCPQALAQAQSRPMGLRWYVVRQQLKQSWRKTQVPRCRSMVKYKVMVHTLRHLHRPMSISRHESHGCHRQSEEPSRYGHQPSIVVSRCRLVTARVLSGRTRQAYTLQKTRPRLGTSGGSDRDGRVPGSPGISSRLLREERRRTS